MFRWIRERRNSTSSSVKGARNSFVEPLEHRLLFAAPKIISIIADNRGEVILQADQDLRSSTINSATLRMYAAGADGKFGTSDDVRKFGKVRYFPGNKRITFRTNQLTANTSYFMKLSAKGVRSTGGEELDGEFNGSSGVPTGNGAAGGDLIFTAKKTTASQTARFTLLSGGAFNVSLFNSLTPKNVANFAGYANHASYDGSFLHRSLPNFIVQGGGFNVTQANKIGQIQEFTPVDNEPHVTHSTRGTIALARPDDKNPATDDKGTSEWFFNLADNTSNLDNQNGGFTAFGQITSAAGLAVMDSLGAFPTIAADSGTFANLPVVNSSVTAQQAALDPINKLIVIRRVAILDKVSPFQ